MKAKSALDKGSLRIKLKENLHWRRSAMIKLARSEFLRIRGATPFFGIMGIHACPDVL